jgi:hypothetical protein
MEDDVESPDQGDDAHIGDEIGRDADPKETFGRGDVPGGLNGIAVDEEPSADVGLAENGGRHLDEIEDACDFGGSSLPRLYLRALQSIARWLDVHAPPFVPTLRHLGVAGSLLKSRAGCAGTKEDTS